ncbi:hypothetical protein FNV43_RR24005 [Rhamnella rubrinervis]|uniref:Uncharacterized protein n=1 Tax=Rhamnella rubrinervis TaxID=2594499 RepID=A0A8K0DRL3_9ROSA|nr:hypothetical protein FNV43_RR24005 [Rhamnella rubrinervis]
MASHWGRRTAYPHFGSRIGAYLRLGNEEQGTSGRSYHNVVRKKGLARTSEPGNDLLEMAGAVSLGSNVQLMEKYKKWSCRFVLRLDDESNKYRRLA